jgi:hypothetical protein
MLVMLLVNVSCLNFQGILMDFKERTLSFYLNDIFQGIAYHRVHFQDMRIAVSLYDELDEIEMIEKSEFPSYLPSSWIVEDKFENIKVDHGLIGEEYSFRFHQDDKDEVKSKRYLQGNRTIEKKAFNGDSTAIAKTEFHEGRHYWEVQILEKFKMNYVIGVVNFDKMEEGMNYNFTDFYGYVGLKFIFIQGFE